MSLRDDVNAGLVALAEGVKFPVSSLDEDGFSRLEVPIPPALSVVRDGQLIIDVRMSPGGERFSLSSPLAGMTRTPQAAFIQALLRRQLPDGEAVGLSFALDAINEYDVLLAIYHWILPAISADDFKTLYQRYLIAVLDVIDEVNAMIAQTSDIEPVHQGRSH